jgi:TPP-dependent trihydroxycyclohexane-1,2-dione (THcHDO) dehydratase
MIDNKTKIIINNIDNNQYASNNKINFTKKSTKNYNTKLDNKKEKKQKFIKKKPKTQIDFKKQVITLKV